MDRGGQEPPGHITGFPGQWRPLETSGVFCFFAVSCCPGDDREAGGEVRGVGAAPLHRRLTRRHMSTVWSALTLPGMSMRDCTRGHVTSSPNTPSDAPMASRRSVRAILPAVPCPCGGKGGMEQSKELRVAGWNGGATNTGRPFPLCRFLRGKRSEIFGRLMSRADGGRSGSWCIGVDRSTDVQPLSCGAEELSNGCRSVNWALRLSTNNPPLTSHRGCA